MYIVDIDKRKSNIPSRLGFDDESSLMDFVMSYIKQYYPLFENKGKTLKQRQELIYTTLCVIREKTDDNYKIDLVTFNNTDD